MLNDGSSVLCHKARKQQTTFQERKWLNELRVNWHYRESGGADPPIMRSPADLTKPVTQGLSNGTKMGEHKKSKSRTTMITNIKTLPCVRISIYFFLQTSTLFFCERYGTEGE